jgi:CheY-like chemotaxis protein
VNPLILVVDDDESIRDLVAMALAPLGYVVIGAADGCEAMAMIAARPPVLVISDVEMPDVDGLELYRALRAQPETETLPFVFVSCSDRMKSLGPEAPPSLRKPFDLERLVALVLEVLSEA